MAFWTLAVQWPRSSRLTIKTLKTRSWLAGAENLRTDDSRSRTQLGLRKDFSTRRLIKAAAQDDPAESSSSRVATSSTSLMAGLRIEIPYIRRYDVRAVTR